MHTACRICAKIVNFRKASKLFEPRQKKLVDHFQILTNILLENEADMPDYICEICQNDIKKSIEFRESCIRIQEYLRDQVKTLLPFEETNDEQLSNDEELLSNDEQLSNDEPFSAYVVQTNETDIKYEPNIDETDYEYGDNLEDGNSSDNEYKQLSTWEEKDHALSTEDITYDIERAPSQENFENDEHISCVEIEKLIEPKDTSDDDKHKKKIKRKKYVRRRRFAVDWVCEHCGKHFTCPSNFKVHILRHNGNKNFQCGQCSSKFVTSTELNHHVRIHTGERPHVCQYCGFAFANLSSKLKHERIHTNDRRFGCTQCDKKFVTTSGLKNHLLVHTQIRSFSCALCDQWFLRRTHLVAHYRSKLHKQNEEKKNNIKVNNL